MSAEVIFRGQGREEGVLRGRVTLCPRVLGHRARQKMPSAVKSLWNNPRPETKIVGMQM